MFCVKNSKNQKFLMAINEEIKICFLIENNRCLLNCKFDFSPYVLGFLLMIFNNTNV